MSLLRSVLSAAFAAALVPAGSAAADTPITVGVVIGYTSLHLPTYVAMERGYYKKEGLDAKFVTLAPNTLVVAGLSGQINFVPIPTSAAVAALDGSPIAFVVGESISSQWEIVADKDIAKPANLKGKTVAFGEPGAAAYDEGARVLSRFFHMDPGKDYKVISFQSMPGEIAALIKGDVVAALVTTAEAVPAVKAGYKVLLKTSTYLPRLGGEVWTMRPWAEQHQDTVKAFVRAIADAIMSIRTDEAGTLPVIQKYLGIDDPTDQKLLWEQLHDGYEATMDPAMFREIFEARRVEMIKMGQWDKDEPLPDVEQFITRNLLDAALKEAHYVPLKLNSAAN